eukprot:tig00020800_g13747.t1
MGTAMLVMLALASVASIASAGNVILDWNTITLDSMVQLLHETSHTSRMVAMVNLAMWDALTDPDVPASNDAANQVSPIGQFAACVAAHNMLISFYPDMQSEYDAAIRRSRLLIGIEQRDEPLAVKIGRRAATKMIVSRVDDGSLAFVDYRLSSEIGHWRPVPPKYAVIPTTPQYQMVQPFSGVEGQSFLLPHGPPPLVSKEYARAFNLTKRYGCRHCHDDDEEKSLIAEFWADGDKTTDRPVAHWCRIVVKLAEDTDLGLLDSARLLRVLSIALADASVAKAMNKYYYDAWRPVTAIRAGVDDNPYLARDPSWEPYLKTENSQEYPSGHGAWAGAAVRVLQLWFGTDHYKLKVASGGLPGVKRKFHRLSEMAEEVLMARIYAGNHFRFSVEAGRAVGEAAANAAWKACGFQAGAGMRAELAAAARRAAALEAAAAAAPAAELERLYGPPADAKPAAAAGAGAGRPVAKQPAAKEGGEGEGPQRLRGAPAAVLGAHAADHGRL